MSWVSDTTLKLQPRLRSRRHAGERGTPTGARCATVTLAHTGQPQLHILRRTIHRRVSTDPERELPTACTGCRSRASGRVQVVQSRASRRLHRVQVARFARRAVGTGREVCAACSWCRSAYLPGFSSRYAVLVGSCCTNCAKGACERLGLVDETGVTAGETRRLDRQMVSECFRRSLAELVGGVRTDTHDQVGFAKLGEVRQPGDGLAHLMREPEALGSQLVGVAIAAEHLLQDLVRRWMFASSKNCFQAPVTSPAR